MLTFDKDLQKLLRRNKVQDSVKTDDVLDAGKDISAPEELVLKSPDKLYDDDGKLNPKYDSSIFEDIAESSTQGMKIGAGQNPYFQLGATIGGAVAGLFNKNIAGKVAHQKEVERIDAENKAELFKTEARLRIDQMNQAMENQRINNEVKQRREAIRQKTYEGKTKQQNIENTRRMIAESQNDPEAFAMLQLRLAELENLNPEYITPTYGLNPKRKTFSMSGLLYSSDTYGNVGFARNQETGEIVVDKKQWMQMVKEAGKLQNLTNDEISDAYDTADALIDEAVKNKRLDFTTSTGKPNPVQRNSFVQKLAEDIMENSRREKAEKSLNIAGVNFNLPDISRKAEKGEPNFRDEDGNIVARPMSDFKLTDPAVIKQRIKGLQTQEEAWALLPQIDDNNLKDMVSERIKQLPTQEDFPKVMTEKIGKTLEEFPDLRFHLRKNLIEAGENVDVRFEFLVDDVMKSVLVKYVIPEEIKRKAEQMRRQNTAPDKVEEFLQQNMKLIFTDIKTK